MRTQLGDRILRPTALPGPDTKLRQPFDFPLPERPGRKSKAITERAAEMRCVAETAAEGDIGHRSMRLGGVGQIGPTTLQPAFAQIMRETVAGTLKQFLK